MFTVAGCEIKLFVLTAFLKEFCSYFLVYYKAGVNIWLDDKKGFFDGAGVVNGFYLANYWCFANSP